MTDPDHIRRELSKAMPIGTTQTHVQMKVLDPWDQWHWVAIPVDAYARMITAACNPEESQP